MSKDFVRRNRHLLPIKKVRSVISHSDKDSSETSNGTVVETEVELGPHRYTSNLVIANCRYDLLLGMPWHFEVKPKTDYNTKIVLVDGRELPSRVSSKAHVVVTNLGVKKFRSLLKRKKKVTPDFAVFQVSNVTICTADAPVLVDPEDAEIKAIQEEFHSVFRDELPEGLPPARAIDHQIVISDDCKPPHRSIFHLSPAELQATKEYVTDLLRKGKIRPSKSPFGTPLFFVKQNGKLRGVIDYRGLNRITKPNNAPIPRTDEMFDRVGNAMFYSKIGSKGRFSSNQDISSRH